MLWSFKRKDNIAFLSHPLFKVWLWPWQLKVVSPPWKDNRLESPKKNRLKCNHCGHEGHTIDHCYNLYSFPPYYCNTKPHTKSQPCVHQKSCTNDRPSTKSLPFTFEQCEQLLSILNSAKQPKPMANEVGSTESSFPSKSSLSSKSTHWILDSGATNHMVSDLTALTHSIHVHNHTLQLPDGFYASVTHTGTVRFLSSLVLTNVICNPTFYFNLIFMCRLCKTLHCLIIFYVDYCVIQDLSLMKMIGMDIKQDGLYNFTKMETARC